MSHKLHKNQRTLLNRSPHRNRDTKGPKAATEAASGVSQEPIVIDEDKSKQSSPPVPMGRMDAFTGSIGQWSNPLMNPVQPLKKPTPAEPKRGQAPEKQSLAMAGEESAPQVTSSEAAPSQETQEGSSNPPQGEGGSSSTSQAAPAELQRLQPREIQNRLPLNKRDQKRKQ